MVLDTVHLFEAPMWAQTIAVVVMFVIIVIIARVYVQFSIDEKKAERLLSLGLLLLISCAVTLLITNGIMASP